MAEDYDPRTNLTVYPERIVSLSPSSTEILFAVGAGQKVVGVTDYCNYPHDLKARIETNEITRVGGYWNPSIDTIVALKPDLVLASTAKCRVKTNECKVRCKRRCELVTQVTAQLRRLGLKVLTLGPHNMNAVLDNILANRPKVYFEVWNDPYVSVNKGTWIGDIINLAGGANIFGDAVSEWPIINPEDIIQRNPDIIVLPVIPGVPRFWRSFEDVKNRSGWKSVAATAAGS